jgi:glycerol-3-phosphate acyltransferase PlsY
MLELGVKITLAYALGAIMGGLVVGRIRGGVDLRKAGSGNVGGTNALRTQGKVFAFFVILIDVGKGIVAVAFLPPLALPGIGIDPEIDRELMTYMIGLAAVVGHVFPVWADFRGGKGGATAAGLLAYLAPTVAVFVIGAWLAVVFFTGYVGVATVSAAWFAAVYIAIAGLPEQQALFVFALLLAAFITYTHRSNLRRMWDGTESRFGRFFGLK